MTDVEFEALAPIETEILFVFSQMPFDCAQGDKKNKKIAVDSGK